MTQHRFWMVLTVATALILATTVDATPVSATNREHSRIVWSRNNKAFTGATIVSADPDGSHFRQLTHPGPNTLDVDAVISPDGRLIVFERDHPETVDVVVVDARGRHEHVVDLGCVEPCAVDLAPSWTLDGSRIVFSRVMGPFDPAGNAQSALLYTAKPDGTDIQRLSEPGIDGIYEDYGASFAPDDSYLTFVRVRNADIHHAIFRMNPDGSDVRQLTPWELDADGPDLSLATRGPTKDLVVFETPHGPPDGTAVDIATVPTTCPSVEDCTNQIVYVTTNGTGPGESFNPSWSPDGRRIAYAELMPGDESHPAARHIWTIRPDGSGRRQVSTSPRFDWAPDWGPAH
jgi:Tol biopolymer transport system component